jgi:hypothetical protein
MVETSSFVGFFLPEIPLLTFYLFILGSHPEKGAPPQMVSSTSRLWES